MTEIFKTRLSNLGKVWLILVSGIFAVVSPVSSPAQQQAQPPTRTAISPPAVPAVVPSGQFTDEESYRRIEALERDMALIKYSMEIVRDVSIALGGLATIGLVVVGLLSWRRERTVQENYKREREFFENSQKQERRRYAEERKFYEAISGSRADQESMLIGQQLEMGTLGLSRFDSLLASQSKNIDALGSVLDVISRASDIRLKREEGHEQFEAMVKNLRTSAERRYLRAQAEADRLRDVKGAQWPTLPLDRRQVAIGALRAYESVDDFVREEREKNENDAARHASLLQRLGVFAYYAEHNYEGAIGYLSDSVKLFGENAVDDEFKPSQAWARHFLGILKKNWPLRTEASGTSLRQAQGLLAAAEGYLSTESGQFLTSLTSTEVLSYLPDQHDAAEAKVGNIVELLEELVSAGKADSIQLDLMQRAYLLRGNIAHIRGDLPQACNCFEQACGVADTNPYAWLSLAEAGGVTDAAREHWVRGLSLLSKPPASEKPETSARVLVFSWGILASRFLGDFDALSSYQVAFDEIASLVEKEGKYTPLFFSPTTKNLVTLDALSQQLG